MQTDLLNNNITIDENVLKNFNSYIAGIVRSEVNKILKNMNIETYKDVKVKTANAYNSATINVVDMVTGEEYSVPNRNKKSYSEGAVVRMYEGTGNYGKYRIGDKLE